MIKVVIHGHFNSVVQRSEGKLTMTHLLPERIRAVEQIFLRKAMDNKL